MFGAARRRRTRSLRRGLGGRSLCRHRSRHEKNRAANPQAAQQVQGAQPQRSLARQATPAGSWNLVLPKVGRRMQRPRLRLSILMLLRARTVLPACSPPIEDGGVFVRNGRIEAVGRFREVRRPHHDEFLDLGDSILLPGLINAHCHLDYTDMVGKLSPGKSFSDWIKAIVALKAGWSYTEFVRSWLNE